MAVKEKPVKTTRRKQQNAVGKYASAEAASAAKIAAAASSIANVDLSLFKKNGRIE